MADEVLTPPPPKTEIKLSPRKNVIPISSLSDLGQIVGDIQNQLVLLNRKLQSDVSPEFKALMEGYVNKANETEGIKVNLDGLKSSYETVKADITQVRDTNRNLINELQCAKEALRNLESQLNTLQEAMKTSEERYKEKINLINKHRQDQENKIRQLEHDKLEQTKEYKERLNQLEEEKKQVVEEKEKIRQPLEAKLTELIGNQDKLKLELVDQSFNFKQGEREYTRQIESMSARIKEFEALLKEKDEQIVLKTKEAEYKDALLNQMIKQKTTGTPKKKKFSFFGLG